MWIYSTFAVLICVVLVFGIALVTRIEKRRIRRIRAQAEEDDRHFNEVLRTLIAHFEKKEQEAPTIAFQGDVQIHPTTCKVCGAKDDEDKVIHCARCGMSHHEDCWTYNGRCARYGCGHDKVA